LIARCLLLAALVPACTPAPGPSTPAPGLSTPAPSAPPPVPLVLTASAPVLPGRYRATHERMSAGLAAPWAQEAADVLGLDLPALASAVGAGSAAAGRAHMILMSPAHQTGDWTYTLSETARVYQILPVRGGSPPGDWVAVLAAAGPPHAQVASASWRLGLAGRGSAPKPLVTTLALDAQISHPVEALWDGISTSLAVKDGKLLVMVEYSHTGSRDACEERFTFLARAEAGPRLVLERRDHVEEPCSQQGRPPGGQDTGR
jgi:hypothetical protein